MRRISGVALAVALALSLAAAAARNGGPTSGRWRGQALGVCWEGSRRIVGPEALDPLVALGANAISQTPFAFMEDPRASGLRFREPRARDGDGWWGEGAEGVREVALAARSRGIATLLKPHVWLHGSWPGDVEMDTEAEWAEWFAGYREFIVGWARFAAELGLEGVCIGTELDRTVVREREWRDLIREVRAVYPGLLTYAANWTHFETVPFWDALDAIGVNAYFPLSAAPRPGADELVAAWGPIAARLEALAEAVERPIVFTEIGYHPAEGALAEPWLWDVGDAALAPEVQARAYQAALDVFLDEPWFGGIFWWKWHPEPGRRRGASASTFSPQGLPAEAVLERVYGARRPR